ncbi:MAG: dTDP-4-dehydrorhamnose 3,5-epimerase [Patescibacteria group bacterium]|jgi:dTDP-4-dehydrorhamnose 3,5-epimerase
MKIIQTQLNEVYIIEADAFPDDRGIFVKIYNQEIFNEHKLNFQPKETYYSFSKKNVIRGMHFQTPPADHTKLVYVTQGKILDVILDIRVGSPNYGKYITIELSAENHKAIYIPSGFAHGFLSLQENSCVIYSQTAVYSPENDNGININSFGMQWGIENPIVSKRDQNFQNFKDFKSSFIYKKP